MRSFDDLSHEERRNAFLRAKDTLVEHVLEGVIELRMANKFQQRLLNKILTDMRKNETVTESRKTLLENDVINRELERVSMAVAEGSGYDENGSFLM